MLEYLFDAELQYRPEMEPLVRTGEGQLIGSGDGRVFGPKIEGTLCWTLFESPGKLVCSMNPFAVIDTGDGARIRFQARGFALRTDEASRIWTVAATLRLESEDRRYRWLDNTLAVWEGEFDAEVHRARYQAYVVTDGASTRDEET